MNILRGYLQQFGTTAEWTNGLHIRGHTVIRFGLDRRTVYTECYLQLS